MSYLPLMPLFALMLAWFMATLLWLRAIHLQLQRMAERLERLSELTGQGLRGMSDVRQSVEMLTVRVDVMAHRLEAQRLDPSRSNGVRVSA